MDLDVQFLIHKDFDLPNLFSVAEVSKAYSYNVVDVFRRKHLKNKTVKFDNAFSIYSDRVDNAPIDEKSIRITDDEIIITNNGVALKVLMHFGHVIKKLKFQCNYVSKDYLPSIAQMVKYINTHSSDSLIELDIVSYVDNFFATIFKPFASVESVSFRGKFKSFDSHPTLRFEQIFPAMRNLSFYYIEIPDGSVIDRSFVNLKNVLIHSTNESNRFREEHAEALVRKNPQINSIGIDRATRSLLKFISQHLSNLYVLSITNYYNEPTDDVSSPIVFENVKNFTIISRHLLGVPENIHFPSLIEFNANAYTWQSENLIDIVHNTTRASSQFKKLKIWKDENFQCHLSNGHLNKLAEHELNLDEIRLKLGKGVTDETILTFLAMNEKTKIIVLSRDDPPNSFQNVIPIIWERFGDDWKVNNSLVWHNGLMESSIYKISA